MMLDGVVVATKSNHLINLRTTPISRQSAAPQAFI